MQRVESGRLKGRRLLRLPRGISGLRPTSARVRGAIFDRLGTAVQGARVLDLFGGSGAMSIEALSRGASEATVIERSARVVRHLGAQASALGVDAVVTLVKADALRFLGGRQRPFDLVIVDPPFAQPGLFGPIAARLVDGWLAPGGVVVCERERVRGTTPTVDWPAALTLEVSKPYGQAVVEFLRFSPTQTDRL